MTDETGSATEASVADDVVSDDTGSTGNEVETEPTQAETEVEPQGETEESGEGEPEESEINLVSVEYDGRAYEVPLELKDALMRQQDYTKKTMSLSEERQVVEAQKAEYLGKMAVAEQFQEDRNALAGLDHALSHFENVNWQQWFDTDPVGAMKAQNQRQMLTEQRQQAETRLIEAQTRHSQEQQGDLAKAREQCRQEVAKQISDWSPELDVKLAEYATAQGYSPEVLSRITNPQDIVTLDKARRFDELKAKSRKSLKTKPTPIKPAATVKGKQIATKTPENMTPGEMQKYLTG